MVINFVKYQACGNDYIYINCLSGQVYDYSKVAVLLSNRHFGIGGDGVVYILKSDVAFCKMRMFNADGSEGKMCGNAVRCVAKYVIDYGYTNSNSITIETLSGIKEVFKENDLYIVNMGKASFCTTDLSVNFETPPINYPIIVNNEEYKITAVTIGNPHAVIFSQIDNFCEIGSLIEKHSLFNGGTNVEFVKIVENGFNVKVWERGSGNTLSCGTGACAATYAGIKNGLCSKNKWQNITMQGGNLYVLVTDDDSVFLKGEAVKVFEGQYQSKDYENKIQ